MITTQNVSEQFNRVRNSPLARVILLGILVLLLQIPVLMIEDVIRERQNTRNEAAEEVTGSWGGTQRVTGPWIVIPFETHWMDKDKDGQPIPRQETKHAWFLPETLDVVGTQTCEVRYRGIYQVPLYRAFLQFSGRFRRPDLKDWVRDETDIHWDRAHLVLQLSDVRAITNRVEIRWNGEDLAFQPGSGESARGASGIHAPLRGQLGAQDFAFSFPLVINGSDSLTFTPFGRDTRVRLSGDWPDPSFFGLWLPSKRVVKPDGFAAEWNIPFLGRNYPEQWILGQGFEHQVDSTAFGVRLHVAVDAYRMAYRSVKYEMLFLVLPFAVLWLFEVVVRVRLHPLHYLFVGMALCLFYLLELSLAEHIGFASAYLLAAAMVVVLVAGYCRSVLGASRRAAVMGGVLALLYGYLHIVLVNQDYALLIGSLGLFVSLAVIMFITRRVDWSGEE